MAKKAAPKTSIPTELPFPLGTLVTYYDEGWRTGHFEGMKATGVATVRPVGPVGKQSRNVNVPLADVYAAG